MAANTKQSGKKKQNVNKFELPKLKDFPKLPEEYFPSDTHYNSASNIEALQEESIELKGPVCPATKEKEAKNTGFEIDLEQEKVVCPMGAESKYYRRDPAGIIRSSFPQEACAGGAR